MIRVGVFICHCGTNIADTVDCARVAELAKALPSVAYSTDYKYLCSEPGQQVIAKALQEQRLDRVVVASCSPRMHESTFRNCLEKAGLNPYLLEMANIREQCSWVHNEPEKATLKAFDLVRMAVAKVVKQEPLTRASIPMTKKALVIGGGIAGIQAALDIAEAGYQVDLVEREPSLGGRMAQIDKTFPTLDCSACILTPQMVAAAQHPNINLLTFSEIEKVEGYVGNFQVTIREKARSVDLQKCTGCGTCWEKCPSKWPSEFELELGMRKAIYIPFLQAVPNKPVIDREHCSYFLTGECRVCQRICPSGAVDFTQQDQVFKEKYGAIVVATGFDLFQYDVYGEYGYGKFPDVISGLQFERLINSAGPTGGKILRPSDQTEPKTVVFIKCVGSRDEAKGKPYCSKTCCMYTAKHATLVREKINDSQAVVFYLDIRTPGKNYEEFYRRAVEEYGVQYIRGRVSKVYEQSGKLIVKGEDTLLGKQVVVEADLVVLATAMIPRIDAGELARKVGIPSDQHNFFTEAHPKLRPVETHTPGVFLAGACQGPKDISETVSQASAAAVKVCGLLSKEVMALEPSVAVIREEKCSGCGLCLPLCPYQALELKIISEELAGKSNERQVAAVKTGRCQGCGACTVACRSGALNLKGCTNEQIMAEVDALCL